MSFAEYTPAQLHDLGRALERQGRIFEAWTMYVVAAQRGDVDGMYDAGRLAIPATGQVEEACNWLEGAHLAGHREAANQLGAVLVDQGDFEGAEFWLRTAAEAGHQVAAGTLQRLRAFLADACARLQPEARVRFHYQLAARHARRFDAAGERLRLDLAVESARAAAAGAAEHGLSLLGPCLNDLSIYLSKRISLTGRLADLDEAVEVGREALTVTPESDAQYPDRVSRLAGGLLERFSRSGQGADLDEAMALVEPSARTATAGTPALPSLLNNMCYALMLRFGLRGRVADLDAAIAAGRGAVASAAPGSDSAWKAAVGLGNALTLRFERTGDTADLDAAIGILRAAAAGAAPGSDHQIVVSAALAQALEVRAGATGRRVDATESADITSGLSRRLPADGGPWRIRQAVAAIGARAAGSAGSGQGGDGRDADADAGDAVEWWRATLERTPPDDPERHVALAELGRALTDRSEQSAGATDLDAGIERLREAVETVPDGHPACGRYRQHLAGALMARHESRPAAHDLDEAISLLRTALGATSSNDPAFADRSTLLASALIIGAGGGPVPGEILREALDAFRAAAHSPVARPRSRVLAARGWYTIADGAGQDDEALASAATAVELLPLLAWHGLDRATREENLRFAAAMPREAAACAIRCGRLERAVELLEQGRSVQWRQALHYRTGLDALAADVPDLAQRLDRVRSALDADAQSVGAEERMRLAREWDDLVAQARALDEHRHFLGPTPFAELAAGTREGPVVIVNVGLHRCDALIITPQAEVELVPLPRLDLRQADAMADRYLKHLIDGNTPGASFEQRERARHTVHDTLKWLWEVIAEPVVTALGIPRAPAPGRPLPRMWWCPTASLTLLPLHAAGRYPRTKSASGSASVAAISAGPSLLDIAVCSYTPTLTALSRTRPAPAAPASPTVLAVGMPRTPGGQAPLPGTREEIEKAAAHVPPEHLHRLIGASATRDAVRTALASHTWAHFACHGRADLSDPSRSALLLWDGQLTVTDIAAQHLQAELALLCACQTAVGGTVLPDESVHPAAALQSAGYRHVIATLWSVGDASSVAFIDTAYQVMSAGGALDADQAAYAVHDATVRLRGEHPTEPSIWAPYIHIGP